MLTENKTRHLRLNSHRSGVHFTKILFENITQEKSITLAAAAVRHVRPIFRSSLWKKSG